MARFSAGGDEDENQERSNDRRSPKKPRISNTGSNTPEKPNAATKASTSTAQHPMLTDLTPEKPLSWNLFRRSRVGCYETEEESEGESEHEPDTSSSSGSEEESDVDETNHDDEVQPAEARVDSVPNGNGSCPDSEEATEHVPVIMTDLRVLDCDICFEPLSSPVFQCENGHIACASCCTTMANKCASCRFPIGYNRCRAIEKVLESVRISCRNTLQGCTETLHYSNKLAHEKTCNYAPCSCPLYYCNYVGISKCLYTHFASEHSSITRQFSFKQVESIALNPDENNIFLQERKEKTLFILNRSVESCGSLISVVCVGPTSTETKFCYRLKATEEDAGKNSIKLKTHVECTLKWRAEDPAKVYLVVPNGFSTSKKLILELVIRRVCAPAS